MYSILYSSETYAAAAAAAKSLQSCPTLCSPIDGSPPSSPVPGILQARTLEWVAMSFSNAWKWKVKVKSLSHVRLLVTPWTAAYQVPPSMGVGCHFLLRQKHIKPFIVIQWSQDSVFNERPLFKMNFNIKYSETPYFLLEQWFLFLPQNMWIVMFMEAMLITEFQ